MAPYIAAMSVLALALTFGAIFIVIFAAAHRFQWRGEKPFREDPRYWVSGDEEETKRRYRAALAEWRQRA